MDSLGSNSKAQFEHLGKSMQMTGRQGIKKDSILQLSSLRLTNSRANSAGDEWTLDNISFTKAGSENESLHQTIVTKSITH